MSLSSKAASVFIGLLVLAFCLFPQFVTAQVLYGTIVGNVKDASGALVPGAAITVTNIQTNQTFETVSGNAGTYTVSNLLPGTYTVKVSLTGFKEFLASGVNVRVNNVTRIDATLQVGTLTETVQVSAESALLQTDKTDVHKELVSQEITSLPTNIYRNYQSLMDLVPGASPSAFQNATFDLPQRSLTTNVNGAARNSNNTRLDGVNNMMAYYPHQTLYVAPQESVQTVSVSTNNFDAEQGMAGGSAITVQTKSGTNDLHAVVFEYLQNSAFSAKKFFTPVGTDVPKRIVNMFGGTLGGPILKDRLFFFAGWEAMRDRQSYSRLVTIATPELMAGDFSGTGVKLYDPLTGNPDGSGRTQFAGARIPDNRIDSVATKMFSLMPRPNLPGYVNNYYASAPMTFDRDNYDFKIDWVRSHRTTVQPVVAGTPG
jgi:hypothetical protein